jgi:hypothetical protein
MPVFSTNILDSDKLPAILLYIEENLMMEFQNGPLNRAQVRAILT